MECRFLHVGAPTLIIEIGGLRLITDPVFDPAGGHYHFGWGTGSKKLLPPAVPADQVGRLDAALLSHDQHQDNLDTQGRAVLASAGRVLTTPTAARRLGGNAEGLQPWQSADLTAPDGTTVKVTATPARHGPPLMHLLSGPSTGFLLEWAGQQQGALYISGDTVWFEGIAEVARRYQISAAVLHLGKASFTLTGPARFTMNAADGIRAVQVLQPRAVIPVHYDGWGHFREPRPAVERAFGAAGLADRLRWLTPGKLETVEV